MAIMARLGLWVRRVNWILSSMSDLRSTTLFCCGSKVNLTSRSVEHIFPTLSPCCQNSFRPSAKLENWELNGRTLAMRTPQKGPHNFEKPPPHVFTALCPPRSSGPCSAAPLGIQPGLLWGFGLGFRILGL